MHELSLAQDLANMVENTYANVRATRVNSARLILGEATCVDPETLTFAFEIVTRNTKIHGCKLEIIRIPMKIRCRTCAKEYISEPFLICENCGLRNFDIVQGREIILESIEVED